MEAHPFRVMLKQNNDHDRSSFDWLFCIWSLTGRRWVNHMFFRKFVQLSTFILIVASILMFLIDLSY